MTALSRQHLWLYQPSGGSASSSPLAVVSTSRPSLASTWGFCASALAASPYAPRPYASCVAAVALSQPCQQSSTPAVPMAFSRPHINPSSTRVNIRAFDLYHLTLSRRHAPSSPDSSPRCKSLSLPSTVRYRQPPACLAQLLSWAFSFVRDGSLLTSRTTSNSQTWTPTLQYGRSIYRLCPLGFSDPTWKHSARQSLDVDANTKVGQIHFTTSWESAMRIDLWLSRRT